MDHADGGVPRRRRSGARHPRRDGDDHQPGIGRAAERPGQRWQSTRSTPARASQRAVCSSTDRRSARPTPSGPSRSRSTPRSSTTTCTSIGAYAIDFANNVGNATAVSVTFSNSVSRRPWSGLVQLPIVPVHSALMRTGEILMWDGQEPGASSGVWKPDHAGLHGDHGAGETSSAPAPTSCPTDGSWLSVATSTPTSACRILNIFDPATKKWTLGPSMQNGAVGTRHDDVVRWTPARGGGREHLRRMRRPDAGDLQPGDQYLVGAEQRAVHVHLLPATCIYCRTVACWCRIRPSRDRQPDPRRQRADLDRGGRTAVDAERLRCTCRARS